MFPAVSDGNDIPALSVKSCSLKHTIRHYKHPGKHLLITGDKTVH